MLFADRIEAVAIRTRGQSQKAALITVVVPRKQRRELSQQWLQAFDVVVVYDASSLPDRPFQTATKAFADFGGEILPAGKAVLTRDHQLRVTLRQRQVVIRQMRARTREGSGVTGGDLAREPLGLFTERFQRRTGGEGL